MMSKKLVPTTMSVLLTLTLLWVAVWFLPELGTGIARSIYQNPVTNALCKSYDDFFPPLLCALFALGNLLFASGRLISRSGSREQLSSLDWIYPAVSFTALALHSYGFYEIFEMLSAG